MLLREYLKGRGRGEISRLVRESGCANSTIHDVLNGKPISRFATAERISVATGGEVTAVELCGPQNEGKPAKRKGRHRSSVRAAAASTPSSSKRRAA